MNLNEVEEKVKNVETKVNYILERNKIITSKQVMDMINEQLHLPTNSDLLKGFEQPSFFSRILYKPYNERSDIYENHI